MRLIELHDANIERIEMAVDRCTLLLSSVLVHAQALRGGRTQVFTHQASMIVDQPKTAVITGVLDGESVSGDSLVVNGQPVFNYATLLEPTSIDRLDLDAGGCSIRFGQAVVTLLIGDPGSYLEEGEASGPV